MTGVVSAQDSNMADGMVAAHNEWRKKVGVGPVQWSADLAGAASEWARHLAGKLGCNMQHSRNEQREGTGENLYWASPVVWSNGRRETQKILPLNVVDSWGSESSDYNASNGTCRAGKVCGHYTQVVWRNSREIGCGMASCGDHSQVWVCRYRPAGNFVGQRPF